MVNEEELKSRVSRLARLGRARDFSRGQFEKALAFAARGVPRTELLRQLLLEWTGIALPETEVERAWERIESLNTHLREKLGSPVSLQTALLHEFHSLRGILREPRILADRDLSALRVNAITDPLTGLYNRRFLLDHLKREISRADRSGGVISVLMMDLAGFKGINDQLGHPIGDGVLVRTARLIRDSLRVVDAGCRYGGDEFVVVLPNTDIVNCLAVAERIRQRVGNIRLPLRVGLNYGVATYPTDGRTLDFLIKMSDLRLYDCKKQKSSAYPTPRRYPRFSVPGMMLKLAGAQKNKPQSLEIKELSYGGLAFVYPGKRAPERIEGEIVERYSSETHRVSMRPVDVLPLREGQLRVGCAYEH